MFPDNGRIALLRLDEIGDFFLWLPYARALLKAFPLCHFTLIGNRVWLDAAEEYLPGCSFFPVHPKEYLASAAYRQEVNRQLREQKFAAVVNPRISRYVKLDDRMQLACGAKRNFAWRYQKEQAYHWKIRLAQLGMNFRPGWQLADYQSKEHELQNNLCFLRFLAGAVAVPDYPAFTQETQPYFLVAPGAGTIGKQWPPERFAQVVRHILQKAPELTCFLCGSEADIPKAEEIQKALPEYPVYSLCGKTSIRELLTRVAKAQFVVGNDTGIIHIAALCKRPAVAVTGGGGTRFLPYPADCGPLLPPVCVLGKICRENCSWHCPDPGPKKCILSVTAEQLCSAADGVLKKG